jgi:GNAT superfamily N-acetyltransferase
MDLDMALAGSVDDLPTRPPDGVEVDEHGAPSGPLLAWYRASRNEFGMPLDDEVLDQMLARDLEVFFPLGMRLFVASEGGRPLGFTSLIRLAGVGYLDGVVTNAGDRRRGVATATVSAATRSSLRSGDEVVHLLADASGTARRLYERLGFRIAATVEAFTRPLAGEG